MGFQESLPPEVDKFDRSVAHKSLRFALALLAPMLVLGEQQRTDIGGPEDASVSPKVNPCSDHKVMSGKRVAENGYVLIQNLPWKPITFHVLVQGNLLSHGGSKAIPQRLKAGQ